MSSCDIFSVAYEVGDILSIQNSCENNEYAVTVCNSECEMCSLLPDLELLFISH